MAPDRELEIEKLTRLEERLDRLTDQIDRLSSSIEKLSSDIASYVRHTNDTIENLARLVEEAIAVMKSERGMAMRLNSTLIKLIVVLTAAVLALVGVKIALPH